MCDQPNYKSLLGGPRNGPRGPEMGLFEEDSGLFDPSEREAVRTLDLEDWKLLRHPDLL